MIHRSQGLSKVSIRSQKFHIWFRLSIPFLKKYYFCIDVLHSYHLHSFNLVCSMFTLNRSQCYHFFVTHSTTYVAIDNQRLCKRFNFKIEGRITFLFTFRLHVRTWICRRRWSENHFVPSRSKKKKQPTQQQIHRLLNDPELNIYLLINGRHKEQKTPIFWTTWQSSTNICVLKIVPLCVPEIERERERESLHFFGHVIVTLLLRLMEEDRRDGGGFKNWN